MFLKSLIYSISLLFCVTTFAQDSLQARIVLIGDAGQLTDGYQPVVNSVRKHIPLDKKTTILYLGDNLYKTGLPDNTLPTYQLAKAPLDSQIHIAGKSPAKVYFIPGNHDWANGADIGYESILRVQSYIDFLGNNNIKMLPRDGCPGPVTVDITKDIMLLIMDSQWWLHEKDKPGIESDCDTKTKSEILTQVDDILSENADKLVLIAVHHPFRSYGPHGGYFTLKQHIFPFTDAVKNAYIPLPIIGSAYPLTRAVFGTIQDIKHPLYQEMIHSVEKVVKGYKNVIFVSGHEHTLQLIQDSGYNYIVSGSGSKSNRVSKGPGTLFHSSDFGYATLEISKSKNVVANFYTVDKDSTTKEFTRSIMNFTRVEEPKKDTLRVPDYTFKDTTVISASDRFKEWTGFKRVVLGENYRKQWNASIPLKEFNIKKEKGGLKVVSLGGGKQTKSLKLEDKNGKEWTLRMVDKDPEKAVPQNLRNTVAHEIVADMVSASHPYSPLVVPTLAKAAGVLAAEPQLFYVPDDPALGKYRDIFANSVCFLEDREPTPDGSDTKSTSKILNKMYESNKSTVDQKKVLTARLLDMLIADWDRHADQWKWGTQDTGGVKGKVYYPVPRDRDQAFFKSDGLLVKHMSKKKMRFLKGFKPQVKDINGLNFVARDFDRTFLNRIDENTWQGITNDFVANITDEVIMKSVQSLPNSIRQLDSAMIVNTLKSRRAELAKKSIDYYKFISKFVNVTGSNDEELFQVKAEGEKMVLSVFRKDKLSDSSGLLYKRTFDPGVTKEIRLYGLNGDDKFIVDPDVNSKIKIRIIGGKGNDTFNLQGKALKLVYDLSQEKNVFVNKVRTNVETSTDVSVIDYKNTEFRYNEFLFPQINLGFNADDGILAGIGFLSRTYGFRKNPATVQKLTTLFSPKFTAYQAKYKGEFNHVISKNDIVVNAEVVRPALNNFFGYGNNSSYDKAKGIDFYRVRHSYAAGDLLIRKRLTDFLQVAGGATAYQYWNKYGLNQNRILGKPFNANTDSLHLYSTKTYLGAKLRADIDYLNNDNNPSRGITWYSEIAALRGMNAQSNNLYKVSSDMVIYASISDKSRVSAVLRAGGGKIFNSGYEYFQAFNLGSENYLRGYRKNRFTGDAILYSGAELRLRLFKSKSYLLPGDVGLMAFYDGGRVWATNENSGKWHNGYGAGLYFVPYDIMRVGATFGFSPEDKSVNISIGTKFNISF